MSKSLIQQTALKITEVFNDYHGGLSIDEVVKKYGVSLPKDVLQSKLEEFAKDIIGKDELKMNVPNGYFGISWKNDDIRLKNKLRAEQRKKAGLK